MNRFGTKLRLATAVLVARYCAMFLVAVAIDTASPDLGDQTVIAAPRDYVAGVQDNLPTPATAQVYHDGRWCPPGAWLRPGAQVYSPARYRYNSGGWWMRGPVRRAVSWPVRVVFSVFR